MPSELRFAPSRCPDRCRQCFGKDRRWAVRRDCQDRRGQRSPHLRRLLQCQVEGLGRHPVQTRHHPAAAVRLYDGEECLRHHAGHRRNGPASQRPVRWLLPGVVGQRFHPSGRPHPGAGHRRLWVRRTEDAGELPAGLSKVRLHGELACRPSEHPGRRLEIDVASAARCRNPHHQEGHHPDGERGRLGDARGSWPPARQSRVRFRSANVRLPQAE
ncbi:hypothetical protein ACVWZ6_004267 [Bradyrhizobium sp. GM6.1]